MADTTGPEPAVTRTTEAAKKAPHSAAGSVEGIAYRLNARRIPPVGPIAWAAKVESVWPDARPHEAHLPLVLSGEYWRETPAEALAAAEQAVREWIMSRPRRRRRGEPD